MAAGSMIILLVILLVLLGFDTVTIYDPYISFRIEHNMDLIKNDKIDVTASAQSRRRT